MAGPQDYRYQSRSLIWFLPVSPQEPFVLLYKITYISWKNITNPRSTQVDKECTKGVHSIPVLKWPFLPFQWTLLLHLFTPLYLHSFTIIHYRRYSVNKPGKSVKEVSHSSTLLYSGVWNQCQKVANQWPFLVDLGNLCIPCCIEHVVW